MYQDFNSICLSDKKNDLESLLVKNAGILLNEIKLQKKE